MAGLQLSTIGQIAIVVKDMDRAVAFYRDVLGMKFLFSAGPHLSFFDCGGIRIMLDIPQDKQFDHPSSIIYFKIADIEAAFKTLEQNKVAITGKPHKIAEMPDHDLWMGFFRDSEGNTLSLMSEVKRE